MPRETDKDRPPKRRRPWVRPVITAVDLQGDLDLICKRCARCENQELLRSESCPLTDLDFEDGDEQ